MATRTEPLLPRRRQTPQVSPIWLLGLLVLAAATTAGCLIIQHKLADLRDRVQAYTSSRTAGQLGFDAIDVAGIRGIRIEGVSFRHTLDSGVSAQVSAPAVYVDVDLVDLFRGQVTIDRIAVDGADVRIERDADGRWFGEGERGGAGVLGMLENHGFRVTGTGCRVELVNVADNTDLTLTPVDFDLMKVAGSPETVVDWSASLAGREDTTASGRLLFADLDDFDGRFECTALTAEDVNVFLPAERHVVQSGTASATVRMDSSPGRPISLWANADFSDVALQEQPPFLEPATGTLTAAAEYDRDTQTLMITSAKARTNELLGEVEGSIAFGADAPPMLDIRVSASQLPLRALVDAALAGRLETFGEVGFELREPSSVQINLTGTPREPHVSVEARLAGADVDFAPKDPMWPKGVMSLGLVEARWDSESKTPTIQGRVVDGTLRHGQSELEVKRLSGDVRLDGKAITANSVSGEITGQAFVGAVDFDVESKTGTFELSGGLNRLEETILAERIKDTRLAGSAMITCSGTLSPSLYRATARVEAGPAQIAFNWFFDKPIGIGASGDVTVEFRPRKTIVLTADAEVASSPIEATVNFERRDGHWRLIRSEVTSEAVDVSAAARCFRLPYQISGGTMRAGRYRWDRVEEEGMSSRVTIEGVIDAITLHPEGGATPFVLREANFDVALTKGTENTGHVNVSVAEGSTPPLGGDTWFVDPRLNDPLLEQFPRVDRSWSYDIAAAALNVPPWKGTNFKGKAYFDRPQSGLQSFSADIEGGRLEGWYSHVGGENLARTYAKWTDIPASYLMAHLKFPNLLTGRATGDVEYSVDRDDPDTKEGKGTFTIRDGQFSADYLVTLLEGRFKNGMEILPPSLKFAELAADVVFERDVVRTPRIHLDSEGLDINGQGQFVTDGDMDYTLEVALSPEAAGEIKPLREGLNLDGLRLAQQDVKLTFEVQGPMFNPTGQVSKLPGANVMIVGGALGLGSEIIDLPRQILVDLLKIGGGLVGATK